MRSAVGADYFDVSVNWGLPAGANLLPTLPTSAKLVGSGQATLHSLWKPTAAAMAASAVAAVADLSRANITITAKDGRTATVPLSTHATSVAVPTEPAEAATAAAGGAGAGAGAGAVAPVTAVRLRTLAGRHLLLQAVQSYLASLESQEDAVHMAAALRSGVALDGGEEEREVTYTGAETKKLAQVTSQIVLASVRFQVLSRHTAMFAEEELLTRTPAAAAAASPAAASATTATAAAAMADTAKLEVGIKGMLLEDRTVPPSHTKHVDEGDVRARARARVRCTLLAPTHAIARHRPRRSAR